MFNEIYPRKLAQLTYIKFTSFVSNISYLEQTFFSRKCFDVFISVEGYPDNCPPRKNAPRLGLAFWSRLRLVLGLGGGGGNQPMVPEENSPSVRVIVWNRVSFAVGRQFSLGTIVLEPCGRFSVFPNIHLLHLFYQEQVAQGRVKHRFQYVKRHNDAGGLGRGGRRFITFDILKFRQIIEF